MLTKDIDSGGDVVFFNKSTGEVLPRPVVGCGVLCCRPSVRYVPVSRWFRFCRWLDAAAEMVFEFSPVDWVRNEK